MSAGKIERVIDFIWPPEPEIVGSNPALPDCYSLHILQLHHFTELLIQVIGLQVSMICR